MKKTVMIMFLALLPYLCLAAELSTVPDPPDLNLNDSEWIVTHKIDEFARGHCNSVYNAEYVMVAEHGDELRIRLRLPIIYDPRKHSVDVLTLPDIWIIHDRQDREREVWLFTGTDTMPEYVRYEVGRAWASLQGEEALRRFGWLCRRIVERFIEGMGEFLGLEQRPTNGQYRWGLKAESGKGPVYICPVCRRVGEVEMLRSCAGCGQAALPPAVVRFGRTDDGRYYYVPCEE